MNQKLLDKFLNHQATDKDIQDLKSDPETAEFVRLSEQVAGLKYPGFKAQENWVVIKDRIKDHVKGQQKHAPLTPDKNFITRLFSLNQESAVLWRIAAVLILALGTYFFLSPNNTALITPDGAHQSWSLPDGSQISLNAGSKAEYDSDSWSDDRTIELEGEAFFDVKKGSTFSVQTNSGVVTVLGTEFNVKVREGQFYVYCYEGLVKVQARDTTLMLPAGNGMRLEGGILLQEAVTIGAKPDWINGESSFENTSLSRVLEELSRQFAVSFEYDRGLSTLVASAEFSGSFTHKDLNIALKSVCQPFGLRFELSGQKVSLYKN